MWKPTDPIKHDRPCGNCGYNLRGLTWGSRCPECGQPATASLRTGTIEAMVETLRGRPVTPEGIKYHRIADSIGYPIDGVLFVRDALRFTLQRSTDASGGDGAAGGVRHVSAADVCAGVRDYARKYFNDDAEAADLLAEWKLWRSEDVGAIVFAFVEEGLLSTTAEDKRKDFRGLFTLDTLFNTPADPGSTPN